MATHRLPAESELITTEVKIMKLRFVWTMVCALFLSLGVMAQQDNGGIKQDTKDAAHATGRAAKKTGRKIGHGTKKIVHKSARATRKGADKVEDKTAPPQ